MKSIRYFTVAMACTIVALGIPLTTTYAQAVNESKELPKITYEEIGEVQPIKDAEFRIGGEDRIFLVEDSWELRRCTQLLPKLPQIDTSTESLLVIMSWKYMARTLKSIERDGDTLVIKLDEAKTPGVIADSYHQPKFLVFKLQKWQSPIRIEINGEQKFTIVRGAEVVAQSDKIWEEILRLHSGGRPTLPQQVRRYKQRSPNASEQEIKKALVKDKERFLREPAAPYYEILFRDLVDIRAQPAIPRIFTLIETMGPHDKALGPATNALVGIGGPEVVEQCKIAMKSWNPRTRAIAIGLLARFATPDMREMARANIAELRSATALNALEILRQIGITKDDVPALVHALDQVAKFYAGELERPPTLESYDGEVGKQLIHVLGELGPEATEALPMLKRFTTDSRLPLTAFQKHAQDAIDKINAPKPQECPSTETSTTK